MSDIERAIKLAVDSHFMQVDKAGKAYILHPLRLMFQCETDEEMIVSVLHDVVEDSNTTIQDLKELGFSSSVLDAIECLTKRSNESYESFIHRISKNTLARSIKIIDIQDNLNLTRLNKISDKDIQRIKKYHKSLNDLLEAQDKGENV